ncbi:chemotaxis protein CheX [Magnetococcales bacterium HHB-1]
MDDLNEKLVQSLRETVQEIAETMLFIEITPKEQMMERCSLSGDASAVVGYSGAIKGSLRLCGPLAAVLKLGGALLGEDRDSMDMEMTDAFSEMGNMIAGGVQSRLEGDLGRIRLSPPVIISGTDHQVSSDHSFACISQVFELEGETFFAEVFFSETKAEEAALAMKEGSATNKALQSCGFSLAVQGFEGGDSGVSVASVVDEEMDTATKVLQLDEAVLAKTLQTILHPEINRAVERAAGEAVKEALPSLAERMVLEEIEKIKKDIP